MKSVYEYKKPDRYSLLLLSTLETFATFTSNVWVGVNYQPRQHGPPPNPLEEKARKTSKGNLVNSITIFLTESQDYTNNM